MTAFDLLTLRFLLASVGCVAAGLAVWTVTSLFQRLQVHSLQRSMWLLGQVAVAATFLVILLPHSERLRVVPPIDLVEAARVSHAAARATAATASSADVHNAPVAAPPEHSPLAYAAQAWLLAYLLGLGYTLVRLWQARCTLHGLAGAGYPMSALPQQEGLAGAAAPQLAVIEIDAPISPMLFGLFRPCLLLPSHLRQFDAIQQHLIVEHELTHLRRGDLKWMSASIALQTLLWFNPFMHLLRARLAWAQELGCDRDVLRDRPATQRKAYATALVAQLRLQHGAASPALAFGAVDERTLAQRIAQIRQPGSSALRPWVRFAAGAALAGIVGCSLVFQPALALRADPAQAPFHASVARGAISCTVMVDAASGKQLLHQGSCAVRVTPASTFNIAVSLMGYDSGILHDTLAPALPFKPGYVDWNPAWRQTTNPESWISNSVLWYAQQVTARLGAARFQGYVKRFGFGNADVSGDPGKDNGLALSWVSSSLVISPVEQVAFLRKVVNRELPLTAKAYDMTARILPAVTLANGWVIQGKTGTASPVLPDGRDDDQHQYGWFVGWAKKGGRTIVFARLVQDEKKEKVAAGWRVKQSFLRDMQTDLDSL